MLMGTEVDTRLLEVYDSMWCTFTIFLGLLLVIVLSFFGRRVLHSVRVSRRIERFTNEFIRNSV